MSEYIENSSFQIELIHNALVLGIKDYFKKSGFQKAILGLSGGIDSAVSLYLAATALGADNVRSLLMPSRYSSECSITDSIELSKRLGTQFDIIDIEKSFCSFEEGLAPLFTGKDNDVTEENIQARIRAVYLMAVSNKLGCMLLNTSNKSELAVGYVTLYGDMAGGLSVIGDVYKTDVYKLAAYINRENEIIPNSIIEKLPSAELRPNQLDSDSLPNYDILDNILYQYIELQTPVDEIIKNTDDKETVNRIIKLINSSEYKRYQAPPVLRISSKAFGSVAVKY
jgi:NAD+ synthase (glutamine-hydrolysing)